MQITEQEKICLEAEQETAAVEAAAEPVSAAPRVRTKNTILREAADFFMPFALVYGFAVILHGHLSPGGGFQGGVVVAAGILLMWLGYGDTIFGNRLHVNILKTHESIGAIIYVILGVMGIAAGCGFARNIFSGMGEIGELISAGTIMLMNYAVGYKVLTGVGCLLLLLIGLLVPDQGDDDLVVDEEEIYEEEEEGGLSA